MGIIEIIVLIICFFAIIGCSVIIFLDIGKYSLKDYFWIKKYIKYVKSDEFVKDKLAGKYKSLNIFMDNEDWGRLFFDVNESNRIKKKIYKKTGIWVKMPKD